MREMHKWKDKVELSLDNRQIFFLFFGLSVVGCFVFALGVMVGRRVDFDTVAQADDPPGGLALLDAETSEPTSYAAGLREDPAPEPTADAPLALAAAAGGDPIDTDVEPPKPGKGAASKPAKPGAAKPGAVGADASATMAAAKPAVADASRKFTLQMKAFAKPEEAEAFAAPLRANGHEVRVEAHEIKGRVWHRVRMGEFDTWEEGLAAKGDFEKNEKTIAYVVRL